MIACSRQVIALDGPQPQRIETLRGADRDIADVLVSAGFQVAVRTCVAARDVDGYDVTERFRAELGRLFYARLREPLLATDVAALLECVTFDPPWGADGGGLDLDEVTSLVPWIAERSPAEDWVVRSQAAATFLRALEFADDGWIGNGTYEIYLYKLAALEVTRGARESSRLSPNHPVPIP